MNTLPAISRFLTVSLGMAEDAAGKGAVSRAVHAAMRREGIRDPQDYEQLFVSSGEVRQRLIDAVVIGETWFFRDSGPFTHLARYAQTLHEARAGEVLNILSAPCATGEEPYSIVMTLLNAGLPQKAFKVDGVDISTQALDKARSACYGSNSFRGNIGADVAWFFQTTPHGREVSAQVVRKVAFYHDNLVSPNSLTGCGPYAIIFCRNLLIYLTPEARCQVFERLNSLLLPGGLLFAGHTETIFWHQRGYLPLQLDRAFALTKPASLPLPEITKATTTRKSSPPLDTKRREINAPEVYVPASGESPVNVHSPTLTATDKQQPAKPSVTEVESIMDEQLQEARRLADRGNIDDAMYLCQEFARTVGPVAEMYCLMGVIHMARKDMNGAEDCFLKALYLDPGHYESLVHISLIYRQKGDKRKAAIYRERVKRNTDAKEKTMESSKTPSKTKTDENIRIRTNE